MKRSVRIIALLLSVVMLAFTLLSCTNGDGAFAGETSIDEGEKYVFEIVYPSVRASSLKFELTDNDLEKYKSKLLELKSLFGNSEGVGADEFKDALYKLLSFMAQIETQRDIAQLQYYCDTSNSAAWNDYLYAYEAYDQAHGLFWEFYNESKSAENELSRAFVDVVQREFGDSMISVTPSTDSYAYEMELLEKEYNSLKNSNASDERMFEVYKDYLIAADGYATSVLTSNYYEYSSKHRYYRGDTPVQRKALRRYVKKYLVPLYKKLALKSYTFDAGLSSAEYTLANVYLGVRYDSFEENYLADYFSSLPKSAASAMLGAFENDRVLIASKAGAYNHAMLYHAGNTPICYFHKDQAVLETMAHEIGHYYAAVVSDNECHAYDLKETQSTANTALMYSYLSSKLDTKAIRSAELYSLSNWVYQVICSVIKDEFDEIIFTRDPSALTLADFDRIMSELIDEYGVGGLTGSIRNQLMTYWRRLGIVYPTSNYCYATAGIAALQIYMKSKNDYSAACEIYRKIVEEPQDDGKFLSTIVNAGLTSPYDEQTYVALQKLAEI